jgi:hypothetical protein
LVHPGHHVNVSWYFIDARDHQRVVTLIVASPQYERAGNHPDGNRRGKKVPRFAAEALRKTKIAKLGMRAKIRGHELSPLQFIHVLLSREAATPTVTIVTKMRFPLLPRGLVEQTSLFDLFARPKIRRWICERSSA